MSEWGYLLPTREQVMSGSMVTGLFLDRARLARDLGFESVWVGDSLLARPRHDPVTLLAGVTAAVPELTIGTAVLLPALRNPVVLAQQLATVDQLSEGKLVVGAGIAADNPAIRSEFKAAGVPFESRLGRFMEGWDLCRALWQGDEVTWDGRWEVRGSLAPTPFREGGPPLWLASSVPQGIARAAKRYEGWFPIGPNLETFTEQQALFSEETAKQGRDPLTTAIYLTVAVGDNAAEAEASIESYLTDYYQMPGEIMRRFQACCGGTVDEVMEFIAGFEAAGASHIVLRIVGDHEKTLRSLAASRLNR